MYDLIFGN